MTTTSVLGAIAASIGSVMALSPLLQARVMRQTGSSRDVSLAALWIFVVNCVGWLAYGISLGNPILIVPNVIALGALAVALGVAIRCRREEAQVRSEAVADAPVAGGSAPVPPAQTAAVAAHS